MNLPPPPPKKKNWHCNLSPLPPLKRDLNRGTHLIDFVPPRGGAALLGEFGDRLLCLFDSSGVIQLEGSHESSGMEDGPWSFNNVNAVGACVWYISSICSVYINESM